MMSFSTFIVRRVSFILETFRLLINFEKPSAAHLRILDTFKCATVNVRGLYSWLLIIYEVFFNESLDSLIALVTTPL